MDHISALAELVDQKLVSGNNHSPGVSIIGDFLDVIYATSMKREESEPLKCAATYLSPDQNPGDVQRQRVHHWNAYPLGQRLPFDSRHLTKVSQAADPTSVIVAVFSDETGKLFIWGFIDQVAVHALRLATRESWHS